MSAFGTLLHVLLQLQSDQGRNYKKKRQLEESCTNSLSNTVSENAHIHPRTFLSDDIVSSELEIPVNLNVVLNQICIVTN